MTPIDLLGLGPENMMAPTEKRSPRVCHLLKLPLELRDLIYRMLLTTPYCTQFSTTKGYPLGPVLEFHLHTEILLVSKQISAEATRILHQGNDFILLKTSGLKLSLDQVPKFKLPSKNRIPRPLLRIEISVADCSRVEVCNFKTLITTPERLPAIICAIWKIEYDNPRGSAVHQRNLSLTLDFNLKAQAKYEALSDLLLKPWDMVSGLQKLELRGDIKEPMRERLEKSIVIGPFPSEVAARLKEHHYLAERQFQQKNYDVAQWRWHLLGKYWGYLFNLITNRMPRSRIIERRGFKDVLRDSLPMVFEGRLMLIKACLYQSKYRDVTGYAGEAVAAFSSTCGRATSLGYGCQDLDPIIYKKFKMSLGVSRLATCTNKPDRLERVKQYILEEPER
jgi:hypothetical protein